MEELLSAIYKLDLFYSVTKIMILVILGVSLAELDTLHVFAKL